MATECVRVDSELLKQVRLKLVQKYGRTKGFIGPTVEEGVQLWLEKEREKEKESGSGSPVKNDQSQEVRMNGQER